MFSLEKNWLIGRVEEFDTILSTMGRLHFSVLGELGGIVMISPLFNFVQRMRGYIAIEGGEVAFCDVTNWNRGAIVTFVDLALEGRVKQFYLTPQQRKIFAGFASALRVEDEHQGSTVKEA